MQQPRNQANQGPPNIVVFADFTCPYSYIGQEQIDRLVQEYDARLIWRPHWLHPEVPPEGIPNTRRDPEGQDKTMRWLKEMSPEMAGSIRLPEKRQYSFLAFAGLEYAMDYGQAQPFRRAVFNALWVQGQDIGELPTLQACADKAGLDGEDMAREIMEGPYIDRAITAVQNAIDLGVNQTPTIILAKTAVLGWNYYEVYQKALAQQGYVPSRGIGA